MGRRVVGEGADLYTSTIPYVCRFWLRREVEDWSGYIVVWAGRGGEERERERERQVGRRISQVWY